MSHASASSLPAPRARPRIFAIVHDRQLAELVPQHAQRRIIRAARPGRLGGVLRDLGEIDVRDEVLGVGALQHHDPGLLVGFQLADQHRPGRAPVPVRSGSSAARQSPRRARPCRSGRPAACGTPGSSPVPLQLLAPRDCPARPQAAGVRRPGRNGGACTPGAVPAAPVAMFARAALPGTPAEGECDPWPGQHRGDPGLGRGAPSKSRVSSWRGRRSR